MASLAHYNGHRAIQAGHPDFAMADLAARAPDDARRIYLDGVMAARMAQQVAAIERQNQTPLI